MMMIQEKINLPITKKLFFQAAPKNCLLSCHLFLCSIPPFLWFLLSSFIYSTHFYLHNNLISTHTRRIERRVHRERNKYEMQINAFTIPNLLFMPMFRMRIYIYFCILKIFKKKNWIYIYASRALVSPWIWYAVSPLDAKLVLSKFDFQLVFAAVSALFMIFTWTCQLLIIEIWAWKIA
jgi:hypothetical protein